MTSSAQPAPQVGKTYEINHSRKGRFTGRVTSSGGEWVGVEIVAGQASGMLGHSIGEAGDQITVRLSLATFKEVTPS